jgi:hypothetical protein
MKIKQKEWHPATKPLTCYLDCIGVNGASRTTIKKYRKMDILRSPLVPWQLGTFVQNSRYEYFFHKAIRICLG